LELAGREGHAMSATTRVLMGLFTGAIAGLLLAWSNAALAVHVAEFVQPFGKLWLNALQMTVVPLVLALVIVGINTATDAAASGRVARRAIVTFLVLLAVGAGLAALVAPAVLSLLPHDPALATALGHATAGEGAPVAAPGWADWFTGIVPANAIAAAAASAMLPLVVFALFFGFALTRLAPARRTMLVEFFQAIADAMIVVVRWVLAVAPLGVFALILAVCARAGLSMLSALGAYILLEIALYIVVGVLMLLAAISFGAERLRRFATGIVPAQVVAASTQSSLASLPAMLESAARLGYRNEVSALVLPMAVSLFRITSPIQYVVSACFIAWAFGIQVDVAHLAAGAALALVISMGSVGLPGQVSFLATNLPVTQAMGLPVGPLGMMLAVDTIPDVFATTANVTADMAATSIVVRRSRSDPR
jgi:Na+/H+-dicarboxylate symporter